MSKSYNSNPVGGRDGGHVLSSDGAETKQGKLQTTHTHASSFLCVPLRSALAFLLLYSPDNRAPLQWRVPPDLIQTQRIVGKYKVWMCMACWWWELQLCCVSQNIAPSFQIQLYVEPHIWPLFKLNFMTPHFHFSLLFRSGKITKDKWVEPVHKTDSFSMTRLSVKSWLIIASSLSMRRSITHNLFLVQLNILDIKCMQICI